jgi:hypothetical protein
MSVYVHDTETRSRVQGVGFRYVLSHVCTIHRLLPECVCIEYRICVSPTVSV